LLSTILSTFYVVDELGGMLVGDQVVRNRSTIATTANSLSRMIPGTRLVVIEGGPHGIPWTHAARVTAELVKFLASRPPSTSGAEARSSDRGPPTTPSLLDRGCRT
jgi:hypothetical protein